MQVKYKMATWLQIMKTKTEVARQNERKKKKKAILSLFLFYYYFSWGRGLGLLSYSLRGSLIYSLRVTLSRNWEACQNNFHSGILLFFGGVLGSSWGHGGIKANLLLNSFFICLRLLGHFWRIAKRGWDLAKVVLFKICHFGKGICLGAPWGGSTDGWKVVDVFCLPKHRRSLNFSLVEGFILYLGGVNPTHPWDLSFKGLLGLDHSNIISFLLCLLTGLFCLLLSLLGLIFGPFDLLQFFL